MSKSPFNATQKSAFARKLRELMLREGWNGAELARRATARLPADASADSVSRQDVAKFLAGKNAPGPVKLRAIAEVFRVEPESLYDSAAMPVPRSADRVAQGNAEQFSIRQTSPDMAWVSINQAVPWPVALKIMDLLKGNK